jgi:hypothetical protein
MRRRNPSVADLLQEKETLERRANQLLDEILELKTRQNEFHKRYPDVMRYLRTPSYPLWKRIRMIEVEDEFGLTLATAIEQEDKVVRGKIDVPLPRTWEWQQDEDVEMTVYHFTPRGEAFPKADALNRALVHWLKDNYIQSLLFESLDVLDAIEEIDDELILQRRREFQVVAGGRKNPYRTHNIKRR